MIWTIIILIAAVVLYMFGHVLLKRDGKKASLIGTVVYKGISTIAVILIAGCVARLVMPVYLTKTNPAILQEMVSAMQAQQE